MADCFILSSVETHASIAPQFAVVKEAGVLSALLSGLFCLGQRVINKCFQCDAIGLAMLEEGQHSAAHAGGVRVNRTNQRAEQNCRRFEQVVPATRWGVLVSGTSAWQIRRMR